MGGVKHGRPLIDNSAMSLVACCFMMTAFILLVYLPVLVSDYAIRDDYTLVKLGQARPTETFEYCVFSGRPLYGCFNEIYRYFSGFAVLKFVRLVGVLGVSAACCMVFWYLRLCGFRPLESLLVSSFMAVLPGFQVVSCWATISPLSIGYLASGLAAIVTAEGVLKEERFSGRSLIPIVLGILLLVCSFFFYQPAAMFFWLFAFIPFLSGRVSGEKLPRFAAVLLLVFTVSSLCGLFAVKVLPALLYPRWGIVSRSALTQNPWGKLVWFVREPLFNAFNLIIVERSRSFMSYIGISVICAGLYLKSCSSLKEKATIALVFMSVLLLSYAPNLLVRDNWAAYRTLVSLSAIVFLFLAYCMKWISEADSLRGTFFGKYGLGVVLVVLLAIGTYSASRNMDRLFVRPQVLEYSFLKQKIKGRDLSRVSSIEVRMSRWEDHVAPFVRYDDFGMPSSSSPYSLDAMVFMVLAEIGQDPSRLPVTVLEADAAPRSAPDTLFVDMGEIRYLR